MTRGTVLALAVLAATRAASAQQPRDFTNEPLIRQIAYVPGRVVSVAVAPGYQLTINFAQGERIQTVAVGDTSDFQISVDHGGSALFVKALVKGRTTNMSIATELRRYTFTLTSEIAADAPIVYTIEFKYPRNVMVSPAQTKVIGSYRLSGNRSLWPTRISDDGEHVFIDWPTNVDLPAVYALDAQGRESLTNGGMRGDHMVVDGIAYRLIFRLDRAVAAATRYVDAHKQ